MAHLCLLSENGSTASRWEIRDAPVSVGRGEDADLVVDDLALSRRHFVISREGTEYFLRDLESQNGTFVDGKPAKSARLGHSDCIMAGRSLFVFVDGQEPAGGTPVIAVSRYKPVG